MSGGVAGAGGGVSRLLGQVCLTPARARGGVGDALGATGGCRRGIVFARAVFGRPGHRFPRLIQVCPIQS